MKEKYKYLFKNVLLFSLSGFIPKILSFLLIPFYTGILSTEEYGVSDLIITTVMLLIPIVTCNIQDAVMRFAMDEKYDKKDTFSMGIRMIIRGGILVIIGAVLIHQLNVPQTKAEYLFFVVLMFFSTSLYNMCSLFCRAIDEVKTITIASIINSVTMLVANIILLSVIPLGLTGYLIANSLGAIVALLYMVCRARLYQYVKTNIDSKIKNDMLAFSFPLIFSVIAWWVNNASDRYILTWMSGIAVSGVYAVAYKIPNLLSMFQNIFSQAWSISVIKEYDCNDKDGFIGNMYTLMNFAMVVGCSIIMIMNQPIAKILYSKDFFEAWKFVPPLLLSVVFNAMSLFIGSIFTAVKDTKTLSISTITGAIVNTVCNFIFIRLWNAYGAAIATLIGYAITLAIRRFILNKHIKMKVNNKREITCYFILVIQMFVADGGWKFLLIQIVMLGFIILLHRNDIKNFMSPSKYKKYFGSL